MPIPSAAGMWDAKWYVTWSFVALWRLREK